MQFTNGFFDDVENLTADEILGELKPVFKVVDTSPAMSKVEKKILKLLIQEAIFGSTLSLKNYDKRTVDRVRTLNRGLINNAKYMYDPRIPRHSWKDINTWEIDEEESWDELAAKDADLTMVNYPTLPFGRARAWGSQPPTKR